jgi:hypothetical protein
MSVSSYPLADPTVQPLENDQRFVLASLFSESLLFAHYNDAFSKSQAQKETVIWK